MQDGNWDLTQGSDNHWFPVLHRTILLALFLALSTTALLGQNQNVGQIRGTVVDNNGAPVPAVSVDAVNTATGIDTHTVTGASGVFSLPFLEVGEYNVLFTKDGFEKFERTGITLHVEAVTVDATLKVGSVQTKVTVTAAPELLQTETSELSTVMTGQTLNQLSLVGGNWAVVSDLEPGVTPTRNNTGGGLAVGNGNQEAGYGQYISVNGAQQVESTWMIDGGQAVLPIGGNPDLLAPPPEAIAEVDVQTGVYGTETGNGMSTFNVITRSGTNQFHGTLSEYDQNTIFNAAPKNWSNVPQPKPTTHWNMYGGSIGGPIVRDKLFFFFDWRNNPTTTPDVSLITYPTSDMRAGNFSNSNVFPTIYNPATTTETGGVYTRAPFTGNAIPTTQMDPIALKIQNYFPAPNLTNLSNPYYNNYYFSAVSPTTQYWYDAKVDGNLSPTNHAYVSFLDYHYQNTAPAADVVDAGTSGYYEFAGQLTDAWTLSPNKINEFHLAVARESGGWFTQAYGHGYPTKLGLNLPGDEFPWIGISTGPGIGIGGQQPVAKIGETTGVVSDNFDWTVGKHTLKFGGEYDDSAEALSWNQLIPGQFSFAGIATRNPNNTISNGSPGVGYADFLLGSVNSWSAQLLPEVGARLSTMVQFFIQDYYKVLPNLTVNVGARYLYQRGWTATRNEFANYDPTLLNPGTGTPGAIGFGGVQIPTHMEAPVSFFSPRVGFSYAPKPTWTIRGGFGLYNITWASSNVYTIGLGVGYGGTGNLQSANSITPVFQLAGQPPPLVFGTAATRTPALLNGQSISYLPYHTPVTYYEEWQLDVQHQIGHYLLQAGYVGTHGVNLYFGTDTNQVVNLGSNVRPNPTYQAINTNQFTGWSNYNSFQAVAERQFNNGLSFLANYTWSKSLDTGTGAGSITTGMDNYQNAYSPAANYAASMNDIRHALSGTAVYQLPIGKGRQIAGNSGRLEDAVIGGWQVSAIYRYHAGTAYTPLMDNNLSGALSGSWYPNRVPGQSLKVSNPSVKEWFNVNAFTQPSPNTFGDSRRNILYSPRYADVDLSLAKTFAVPLLGKAGSLQVRGDSYDAFNHPNYGLPNASINSPGEGTISSNYTTRAIQLGAVLKF
ncbi:MAG: TonB-dependent receptor [Acidobacteriaceae bacterium]